MAADDTEEPASVLNSHAERITGSKVRSSRAGRVWKGLVPALILVAVIVVFVVQNHQEAKVSFFTFSGRFPLAVALLVAVALGALVVFCLGSVRIVQLRKAVRRRQGRHDTTRGET